MTATPNTKKLRQWLVLPSHIVRHLKQQPNFESFLNQNCDWCPIYESALIVYETKTKAAYLELHARISDIPSIKAKLEIVPTSKSKIFSPGFVFVDWLPIFEPYMEQGVFWSGFNWQRDAIQLSVGVEDKGAFTVWPAQRLDPKTLKWTEDQFGLDLSHSLSASRVKLWIIFGKSIREDKMSALEKQISEWGLKTREISPLVGGTKGVNTLNHIIIGKKKSKPAMYCEINFEAARQEGYESLIAMLTTYSELVTPIEQIIVA